MKENQNTANNIKQAIYFIKSRYGMSSQDEIAERLGVTNNYISGLQKGTFPISRKMLKAFENAFAINPDYINGESDNVWKDNESVTAVKDGDFNARLDAVVNAIKGRYGITTNAEICKSIGVGNTYISDVKKGKFNMREQNKLAFKFVFGINPLFFDGKSGEIWADGFNDNTIKGNGNTSVMGYHNNVNSSEQLNAAMREIEEQRKLVSKAQDQIDRLITIIENCQSK